MNRFWMHVPVKSSHDDRCSDCLESFEKQMRRSLFWRENTPTSLENVLHMKYVCLTHIHKHNKHTLYLPFKAWPRMFTMVLRTCCVPHRPFSQGGNCGNSPAKRCFHASECEQMCCFLCFVKHAFIPRCKMQTWKMYDVIGEAKMNVGPCGSVCVMHDVRTH